MFEQSNSDFSSTVTAEAKWYIAKKDDDTFIRQNPNISENINNLAMFTDKAKKKPTDILTVSYDIIPAKKASHQAAHNYSVIPRGLTFFYGKKITIFTASGRSLTKEEYNAFTSNIKKLFTVIGSALDASYMEIIIDGQKSTWTNHKIYHKPRKTSPDIPSTPDDLGELFIHILKSTGIDTHYLRDDYSGV